MNEIWQKLKSWNEAWHDLPRRAFIVLSTALIIIVAFRLFKYLSPFVIALVFSWIILPLARPLEKGFEKLRMPKKAGDMLAVVIVFGILAALLALLTAALVNEARDLVERLPDAYESASEYLSEQAARISGDVTDRFGEEALATVYNLLLKGLEAFTDAAMGLASSMVSFTWSAVSSLPQIFLVILFTIMESYYIVAERDDIEKFLMKWTPGGISSGYKRVKGVMFLGLRAQFVTAVIQMLLAFVILLVGFSVLGIEYEVILAVLISVLDALPVIGAGLIMLPMVGIYIIMGQYMLALGVMALYIGVLIVKRVTEPKLIGKQMRLTQLATMMSMYAGFVAMGYLGLLVGPLMMILFRTLLPAGEEPAVPERRAAKRGRKS